MPAQDGGGLVDRLFDELVALERSALDRWIWLDPQGYLDLQAPEVTYFDPFTERRIDGLDAMQLRLAPMKKMKSPFTDPRYDMIDPKVQRHGDVALLTFNLVNYGKLPDAPERVLARWNSTEGYSRSATKTPFARRFASDGSTVLSNVSMTTDTPSRSRRESPRASGRTSIGNGGWNSRWRACSRRPVSRRHQRATPTRHDR